MNKIIIAVAICILIIGYIILTFANREATNLASYLAPLLIVLGYGMILVGLVLKTKQNEEKENTKPEEK